MQVIHKIVASLTLMSILTGCSTDDPGSNDPDTNIMTGADVAVPSERDSGEAPIDMDATDQASTDDMQAPSSDCAERDDSADKFMVVSRPTSPDLMARNLFEVLSIGDDGSLGKTGTTFEMGLAPRGRVRFTPDGSIGFVPQDGGSLGIFMLDASGTPEVVEAQWTTDVFVSDVVVDPAGEFAYVIHTGFRDLQGNDQGGIYRYAIDCKTGTLEDEGIVAAAKLARHFVFASPTRAIVASNDLLDNTERNEVHLLDLNPPTRVSSTPIFEDEDSVISHLAVTPRHAFVSDTSLFGTHRIGVAQIDGDSLEGVQVITGVDDPASIVVSPWNNAVIVALAEGNSIEVYDYVPDAAQPLTARESLSASLPEYSTALTEGRLQGHVYISQVGGIRHLEFESDANVVDHGLFEVAEGIDGSVGALGAQP